MDYPLSLLLHESLRKKFIENILAIISVVEMVAVPLPHCDCSIAVSIMDIGESCDSDCVDSNAVIEAVLPLLLVQPFNGASYTKFFRKEEKYM